MLLIMHHTFNYPYNICNYNCTSHGIHFLFSHIHNFTRTALMSWRSYENIHKVCWLYPSRLVAFRSTIATSGKDTKLMVNINMIKEVVIDLKGVYNGRIIVLIIAKIRLIRSNCDGYTWMVVRLFLLLNSGEDRHSSDPIGNRTNANVPDSTPSTPLFFWLRKLPLSCSFYTNWDIAPLTAKELPIHLYRGGRCCSFPAISLCLYASSVLQYSHFPSLFLRIYSSEGRDRKSSFNKDLYTK